MACCTVVGKSEGTIRLVGFNELMWIAGPSRGPAIAVPKRPLAGSRDQEKQGDERQIMELYDALGPALFGFLRGKGLTTDEAEDTIQEAFLRLALHLVGGGDDGNLRSWLFQVAHNISMDVHRASRRVESINITDEEMADEPVDPGSDPELRYLQKEQVKHLMAAMSRLTPRQRSCILLRAEGLRYWEIASVIGVSEQRVIHLVKRGLLRLAGEL